MSVNFNDRLLAWGTLAAALLMAVPLAVAAIADRGTCTIAPLDLQKEHVSQEQRLENNEGGWCPDELDLSRFHAAAGACRRGILFSCSSITFWSNL